MASDFSNKQKLPARSLLSGSQGIRDLDSTWWFSPLQPIRPTAPPSVKPRQFAYTPGANILWTPKGEDSPVSYEVLRELASTWDLLRIVLETQLDRICRHKWEFRKIEQPGESKKKAKQASFKDQNIKDLTAFFRKPDGFHTFRQWMRMWLEDLFVVDAVALYLARDGKVDVNGHGTGRIASIMPLAGDTITRYLTDEGVTPLAPSTAYAQVLYGTPAINFTVDNLVFHMRNERTNKRFGYSPVEQIINTVCFGLRRFEWQISEYTSGNVPEALVFLPSDLPIDRVKEVQDYFDGMLSGDLQNRRRMRFLPGYGTGANNARPNVIFPKEPLIKDDLDVWLAQVVCFCIGISPQPFMKAGGMNRATAQVAQDTSEEEGTQPYIDFIQDVLNGIIQDYLGLEEYEAVPQQHRELDVLKQAQADNLLIGKKYTINEMRERTGDDPSEEPEANMLGVFSPQNGFIPLSGPRENQMPPGKAPGDEQKPGAEGPKAKPNGAEPRPSNGNGKVPKDKAEKVLQATREFIKMQRDAVNYEALCERVGVDGVAELHKLATGEWQEKAIARLDAMPPADWKGETRKDLIAIEPLFLGYADSDFRSSVINAYKETGTRAAIEEALANAETREVAPEHLYCTQHTAFRSRITEYIEGKESSRGASSEMPWVVRENGVDKVMDGHHRLIADILLGRPLTQVKFTDLTEARKILNRAVLRKGEYSLSLWPGREELVKAAPQTDSPWVGVDLDATLAEHIDDEPYDPTKIGKPVPKMIAYVKDWLTNGHPNEDGPPTKDIRIFSARVADDLDGSARAAIQAFCLTNIGQVLPITNAKDRFCIRIYDDRAQHVIPNTGILKAFNPDEARDEKGEWTSAGAATTTTTERSERAKSVYKPSTAAKQRIADKSEADISKALGIPRTSDNSPFDLQSDKVGIEIKTFVDQVNSKVTCHPESCARKREAAEKFGLKPFTVVADKRGGRTQYYYKQGVGSFRLGSLQPVTLAELRSVINPLKKARRTR